MTDTPASLEELAPKNTHLVWGNLQEVADRMDLRYSCPCCESAWTPVPDEMALEWVHEKDCPVGLRMEAWSRA